MLRRLLRSCYVVVTCTPDILWGGRALHQRCGLSKPRYRESVSRIVTLRLGKRSRQPVHRSEEKNRNSFMPAPYVAKLRSPLFRGRVPQSPQFQCWGLQASCRMKKLQLVETPTHSTLRSGGGGVEKAAMHGSEDACLFNIFFGFYFFPPIYGLQNRVVLEQIPTNRLQF